MEIKNQDEYINRLYEGFKWYFSPTGITSNKFDYSVRVTVWATFSKAFSSNNLKEIRLQFRKSFHPDTGINALSTQERTAVFSAFYPILNFK